MNKIDRNDKTDKVCLSVPDILDCASPSILSEEHRLLHQVLEQRIPDYMSTYTVMTTTKNNLT
jgi:hypothetical protein